MTKTAKTLIIIGGVAFLGGLFLYMRRQFKLLAEYEYKIVGFKFRKLSGAQVTVDVTTRIFNKSNIEATVKKIYLEIFVENAKVGFVTEEGQWNIPAKGSTDIQMKITVNPQLLLKNAAAVILSGAKQKDLNFTLQGYANVSSGFLSTTIPITYSDKVSAYL
jgi:LEA14-like dessication related protein